MAGPIRATYAGGDRIAVTIGSHTVFSDQPIADGGGGTAPTPTELFIAGLVGCIAFFAERFLRRNALSTDGLAVGCTYSWAENPHRVGGIQVTVDAPGLTPERRQAFERVIERCTIHNTLAFPPAVGIRVAEVVPQPS